VPCAAEILVSHANIAVTLDLHENAKKAQTGVPNGDFLFAAPDDFGIDQRPIGVPGQIQKNYSQPDTKLRRRDTAAIAGFCAPMRQSVAQILDQSENLRRTWIVHASRGFPQRRIAQLQHSANRHLPPLTLCAPPVPSDPALRPPSPPARSSTSPLSSRPLEYAAPTRARHLPRRALQTAA